MKKPSSKVSISSRRKFIQQAAGTAAALGFPSIVPASVFGQYAPSKRVNIGAIGVGRISRTHDMPGILQYDNARIIAVCDLDAHRVVEGKQLVNDFYTKKTGKTYDGTIGYANYHELLANKDIDAVVISTPDHWHALIAIDAVRAGKDVYVQKPASLTISEGRAMSNAVQATGRILQIGSQQRSTVQFVGIQVRSAPFFGGRHGHIHAIARVTCFRGSYGTCWHRIGDAAGGQHCHPRRC